LAAAAWRDFREKGVMRFSYIACLTLALLVSPASAADDKSGKQEVEKIAAAFPQNFDKQDSSGIRSLFTSDGVLVNPTGPHTDIAQVYDGAFKAGMKEIKIGVTEATPVGPDTMIGIGEYSMSGKNASGAALEGGGNWTATYVRQGGTWKIRMLTGFPKAPPPK
jgi:ketosteroid isomerase-like protein